VIERSEFLAGAALHKTVVGPYAISQHIAKGGMASVYLGYHVESGSRVAIKVMSDGCTEKLRVRERFAGEGELMRRLLGVPNIVKLLDDGTLEDGRPFLVMEWLEGDNLEDRLTQCWNREERLDVWRATRFALQIARAIEALHARHVVHRDLKPGNVMIHETGPMLEQETAKLIDFGIAADLLPAPEPREDLTGAGAVGTDNYGAPEQLLGNTPDPSMDIWSFGALLLELYGETRVTPYLRTEGIPPRFRPTGPSDLRPKILRLIRGCLQRDPTRRPSAQTIRAYLEVLGARLDEVAQFPLPGKGSPPDPLAGGFLLGNTVATDPVPPESNILLVDLDEIPGFSDDEFATEQPLRAESTIIAGASRGQTKPVEVDAPVAPDPEDTASPIRGGTQPNRRKPQTTAPAPAALADAAGSPDVDEDDEGPERTALAIWLGVAVIAVLVLGVVVWGYVAASDNGVPPVRAASPAPLAPSSLTVASPPEVIEPPPSDPPPTDAVEIVPPGVDSSEHEDSPPATADETSSPSSPTAIAEDASADSVATPSPTPSRKTQSPSSASRPPLHSTPACAAARLAAKEAAEGMNWNRVLSETKRAGCWPNTLERKFLRVEALLLSERFDRCVTEGDHGPSTPEIDTMVRSCRKHTTP